LAGFARTAAMGTGIDSYRDFWPVYLRAHRRAGTRLWHGLGSGLGVLLLIAAAVAWDWRPAVAAVFVGYGCAWIGHVFVESNRPATFGHPVWSLLSDFRMMGLWLTGRLGPELRRHGLG